MSVMIRLLLLGLLLLLVSCGRDQEAVSTVSSATSAAQEQAFSQGTWLRERLPADTIVYLRVPSPWRTLLGPADKTTDRMYQSAAYVAAMSQLRQDLAKDSLSGELAQPLAGLLYRLNSPIEMATIAAGRMASPAANVYLTLALNYPDAASLAAVLIQLPDVDPALAFDDQGYAELPLGTSKLILHFDATNQRLSMLGGMYATADAFKTLRASINEGKVEARAELTLEREIDAAGHGMVLWADVEALRPILGMAATDEYTRMALDQTKRIALGWGTIDGHGRMSLRAEIAGSTWTRYLPQAERRLDLKTAGPARVALSMSWPVATEVERIVNAIFESGKADPASSMAEIDAKLIEVSGLTLAQWFAPFGPDLALYTDDAGDFLALRLKDAEAFKKLLDASQQKLQATLSVTQLNGASIHHLRLPSLVQMGKMLSDLDDQVPELALMQAYARVGSHLYWIEQDGWLILSSVPQPLVDRVNLGADQPLSALFETSGSDPNATFSVAGTLDDAARRTYYAWLGGLSTMAELGGAKLDLITLPTARELALPRQTAMGLSLQLNEKNLRLDLNYAQNPAEFLGGSNGMTAVAIVGVLTAIAVPSYQDYVVRSEVAMALQQASALKMAVAEHYQAEGELPESAEQLGMDLPLLNSDGKVSVDLDNGAILISFTEKSTKKLGDHYLYLLPALDQDDTLEFRCGAALGDHEELLVTIDEDFEGTDIDSRYLPAICRAE